MDSFKNEYFESFGKLYRFMQKHYNATSLEDWIVASRDLKQFKTGFEIKVGTLIFNEMEKNYEKRKELNRSVDDRHVRIHPE